MQEVDCTKWWISSYLVRYNIIGQSFIHIIWTKAGPPTCWSISSVVTIYPAVCDYLWWTTVRRCVTKEKAIYNFFRFVRSIPRGLWNGMDCAFLLRHLSNKTLPTPDTDQLRSKLCLPSTQQRIRSTDKTKIIKNEIREHHIIRLTRGRTRGSFISEKIIIILLHIFRNQ